MRRNSGERISGSKAILGVALATGVLLLVPAVAMLFTHEVAWGPGDFAVAAMLLFGGGTLAVLGARRFRKRAHQLGFAALVAAGLLLVWAELAVGLFR